MNNLGDLKTEFLVRMSVSTTVGYYTDDIIADWLNTAHLWAAGLHKWPFTEGRVSTTFASFVTDEDGNLAGDYPEGWKADGIRLMTIGGKRVDKKIFQHFQRFREEESDADDRIFTDFNRRLYINPNIDISGTVAVWGQYTPADFDVTDLTALTVFQGAPEANDAIVEESIAYAMLREKKPKEAQFHHQTAMNTLQTIWQAIQDEQHGYQTKDVGMFERFDILQGELRDDLFKRNQWY